MIASVPLFAMGIFCLLFTFATGAALEYGSFRIWASKNQLAYGVLSEITLGAGLVEAIIGLLALAPGFIGWGL